MLHPNGSRTGFSTPLFQAHRYRKRTALVKLSAGRWTSKASRLSHLNALEGVATGASKTICSLGYNFG